jgi:uncharacterized protein (DUF488 family)
MAVNQAGVQLFTIGHSTREIDAFIALLTESGVTAVADLRSSPYSKHSPQFNADTLRRALFAHQIQYVFLGEELGARRSEPECYVDDVAKYELIARTDAFARGIHRLRSGLASHRIALLCAEKDPLSCHRMILVCRHLRDDVTITHIIDPGECETQDQAEARLLKLVGLPDRDLFRSRGELLDEAYSKQGDQIAYRRESLAGAVPMRGD